MNECVFEEKEREYFRRGDSKGTKSISHSSALQEKPEMADI